MTRKRRRLNLKGERYIGDQICQITPKKIYLNLNQKKMARDTFSMALELESGVGGCRQKYDLQIKDPANQLIFCRATMC
ncbi:hypothetical protein ACLB2K_073582 [Fragaria x ananassa]